MVAVAEEARNSSGGGGIAACGEKCAAGRDDGSVSGKESQSHRPIFASFGLDEHLPPEGQTVPGLVYDFQAAILYLECKQHHKAHLALRQWKCPVVGCTSTAGYRNSNELGRHLHKQHRGHTLCACCLVGRPLFPKEHELFPTAAALSAHVQVAIHPTCQFCNLLFFDAQALLAHMQTTHVPCPVCPQVHPQLFTFHRNIDAVRQHALETHMCCKLCLRASVAENVHYEFTFAHRAALLMHLQGVHGVAVDARGHITGVQGGASGVSNLHVFQGQGRGDIEGFGSAFEPPTIAHPTSSAKGDKGGSTSTARGVTLDATSADPNVILPQTLAQLPMRPADGRGGRRGGIPGRGLGGQRRSVDGMAVTDATAGENILPADASHDRLPPGMRVAGRVTGSGIFQRQEGEEEVEISEKGKTKKKGQKRVPIHNKSHMDFPGLAGGDGSGAGAGRQVPSVPSAQAVPSWGARMRSTGSASGPSAAASGGGFSVTAPLAAREIAVFKRHALPHASPGGGGGGSSRSALRAEENSRARALRETATPIGGGDALTVGPRPGNHPSSAGRVVSDPFAVLSGVPAGALTETDFFAAMDESDADGASAQAWTALRLRVAVRRFALLEHPLYPPFIVNWTANNESNRRLVLQMEVKLDDLLGPGAGAATTSVQMRALPGPQRAVLMAYATYFGVGVVEQEADLPDKSYGQAQSGAPQYDRKVLSFVRRMSSAIPSLRLSAAVTKFKGVVLELPTSLRDKNVPRLYFAVLTSNGAGVGAARQVFRVDDILHLVASAASTCVDAYRPHLRSLSGAAFPLGIEEISACSLGLVRDVVTIGAGAMYVEFDTVATAAAVFAQLDALTSFPLYEFFSLESGFHRSSTSDGDNSSAAEMGRVAVETAVNALCARLTVPPSTGMPAGTGAHVGAHALHEAQAPATAATHAPPRLPIVPWDESSSDEDRDGDGGDGGEMRLEEYVPTLPPTAPLSAPVPARASVPAPTSEGAAAAAVAAPLDDWASYLAAKRSKAGTGAMYRAPTGPVGSRRSAAAPAAPTAAATAAAREQAEPAPTVIRGLSGVVDVFAGLDSDADDAASEDSLESRADDPLREEFVPPVKLPIGSSPTPEGVIRRLALLSTLSDETAAAAVELLGSRTDASVLAKALALVRPDASMDTAVVAEPAPPPPPMCADCEALPPTDRASSCIICQTLSLSLSNY